MKKLVSTLLALSFTTFIALAARDEATQPANIEVYKIDPDHSSVKFSIRHFVAKTTGNFSEFGGMITVNRDDLTKSSVEAFVKIPSVDTDNEKRDAHLQEEDYFAAGEHPLMVFQSTKWEATEEANEFKVTGDLRMRSITREVVLDVELLGFGEGMRGAYLSGWEASTTLDRTQWNVDGGQPAVGAEVDVTINVEAIRQ
jgi:polyisoprenoid-binding protein YceI